MAEDGAMQRALPLLLALLIPAAALAQATGKRPPPPPVDALAAPGGAGFAVDGETGCWLWSRVVPPGATVRWSGPCLGGPATGQGELVWRFTQEGREQVVRYVGSLVAGRMHGAGTYYYANGSRFDGTFRDHLAQGEGIYAWADGRRYEGGIVNGLPSGRGVGTMPGGERYEGAFVNGRPHGDGLYRDAAGAAMRGAWREGCLEVSGRVVAFFRTLGQCQTLLRLPPDRPV